MRDDLFQEYVTELSHEECGLPTGQDHRIAARHAETLVLCDLHRMGYRAFHVDSVGYDLLVDINNKVLRVQVKWSGVVRGGKWPINCRKTIAGANNGNNDRTNRNRNSLHCRPYSREDTDIFGFVHRLSPNVVYRAVEDLVDTQIIIFCPNQFNNTTPEDSLKSAIRFSSQEQIVNHG